MSLWLIWIIEALALSVGNLLTLEKSLDFLHLKILYLYTGSVIVAGVGAIDDLDNDVSLCCLEH